MYRSSMPQELTGKDITGIDDDRIFAVMAYLFILVFVPLTIRRNDPFVLFHVKQGLVILVGFVLAVIATYWSNAFGSLLFLLLLIANVLGLVQALSGRRWKIPLIGDIAHRFTL